MSIVSWAINFILQSAFVWMPILLGIVFFHSYMAYMRKSFKQNSLEYVML
ncbi:MAG: putative membrane protein, partial [Candidatus Paceibacteria bacterium]